MEKNAVRAFAPATVANVACGFDILGFALEYPGDEVIVRHKETPGVTISKIYGDGGKLPLAAEKNTAGVAVLSFLKHVGSDRGVEIELRKNLPLGSGLGSSASSAVAAVYAANVLFDRPFTSEELLPFVLESEKAACGAAHADNAAPALLGGVILVRSYQPLDLVRIPVPPDLCCTVIHPHIELRTEDARRILKKEILLKDAIIQWGNIGGLIAGFMKSDYGLISRSLQDVLIEPVRALLIPGFEEVKNAALMAGALGCSISGSGPSVFALSASRKVAEETGVAMQAALEKLGIESDVFVSGINARGPKILDN